MSKEQAKTDYTYCDGINCTKTGECWRYAGHYEFNESYLYSFVPGNEGEFKCIEEE